MSGSLYDRTPDQESRFPARSASGRCTAPERPVVLAVLVCVVFLAVIGLGFYGLKSRTGWLRIQVGIWRLVTFSIEAGQPVEPEKPRDEQKS
jgi:hypothetical protein